MKTTEANPMKTTQEPTTEAERKELNRRMAEWWGIE
jgi:hypothetical protein